VVHWVREPHGTGLATADTPRVLPTPSGGGNGRGAFAAPSAALGCQPPSRDYVARRAALGCRLTGKSPVGWDTEAHRLDPRPGVR
jgi:hypothetical protein